MKHPEPGNHSALNHLPSDPDRHTKTCLQEIAENAPGLLYQCRWSEAGSISFPFISAGCHAILGLEAATIQADANALIRLIHPEDLATFHRSLALSRQFLQPWHWRGYLTLPTGKLRSVQMVAQPTLQACGDVTWNGILTPITPASEAQPDHRFPHSFLVNVINHISDPIFIKDRQHRWFLVNDAFCNFMGHHRSQLIGKMDEELFPPAQADRFWQKEELVFTTGAVTEDEECCTNSRQESRLVSVKRSAFEDESGNTFLVGIVQDITHHQQTEALLCEWNQVLTTQVEENSVELAKTNAILQTEIAAHRLAVEQRQASENYQRQLLENLPIGLALCRMDGVLLEVNPAYAAILGRTVAETLHLTYWDITPQKYAEAEQAILESLRQTGRYGPYEKEYLHKDGHLVPVRLSGLIVERQGEPLIWSTVEDISDRLRAEEKLLRIQTAVESSSDAIGIANADGQSIYHNPAFEQLFGYTVEELNQAGGPAVVFSHPNDAKTVFAAIQQGQSWCGEVTMRNQAGQTFQVHLRANVIRDQAGKVIGLLGSHTDMTDRKQAEEEFWQSQQRLALLIQQSPLAVIEWDKQLNVQAWNPAAEKIFGYQYSEAVGRPFSFLVPPEERDRVRQIFDDLLVCPTEIRNINQNITKAGRVITCEWYNLALIDANGELVGSASLALDISDRIQAETAIRESEAQLRQQAQDLEQALRELQRTQLHLIQNEKMSSLGQLVAGVAHEINNPVNFIYGNLAHAHEYAHELLELLQLYQHHYPQPAPIVQAKADAIDLEFIVRDLPKLLNSMKVGADRIQQIVTSLRNFSRMDEAEMKAVDVHEGIDSTLMILQSRLKAKPDRPEIRVLKSYGKVPATECYAGQLNQVFMNILINAIDALEEELEKELAEGRCFTPMIQIMTQINSNRQIEIHITDNGPGIPKPIQQRLFDPFFTTKAIGKGTGMGLSISYQIIHQKHEGSLSCFSTVGKGTTFTIVIPLKSDQ